MVALVGRAAPAVGGGGKTARAGVTSPVVVSGLAIFSDCGKSLALPVTAAMTSGRTDSVTAGDSRAACTTAGSFR